MQLGERRGMSMRNWKWRVWYWGKIEQINQRRNTLVLKKPCYSQIESKDRKKVSEHILKVDLIYLSRTCKAANLQQRAKIWERKRRMIEKPEKEVIPKSVILRDFSISSKLDSLTFFKKIKLASQYKSTN